MQSIRGCPRFWGAVRSSQTSMPWRPLVRFLTGIERRARGDLRPCIDGAACLSNSAVAAQLVVVIYGFGENAFHPLPHRGGTFILHQQLAVDQDGGQRP